MTPLSIYMIGLMVLAVPAVIFWVLLVVFCIGNAGKPNANGDTATDWLKTGAQMTGLLVLVLALWPLVIAGALVMVVINIGASLHGKRLLGV